jgi:diaminopimelate epimerase
MKFSKMHGLGNDYIYVNGWEERIDRPAELARAISDRHTGVGSDGLILILPSDVADVRMEMYNADGSRAQMCGNGIRCVAKYAVEHGLAGGPELRIETDAGVKRADCRIARGKVDRVRVDMGRPQLNPESLPSSIRAEQILDYPLRVGDFSVRITCVSMGNPHAVVFSDGVGKIEIEKVGPQIEMAKEFPERINVHFAEVRTPELVVVRTWERGSGVTRACGTGACAVCVAGALTDRTQRAITACLPGGDLEVEWGTDGRVYMTGPAVEVFVGAWPIDTG